VLTQVVATWLGFCDVDVTGSFQQIAQPASSFSPVNMPEMI